MNKSTELKNYATISSDIFLTNYNKNIPRNFPRATNKALEKFKIIYPNLFKNSDEWSTEKHRKRFMDWLSSLQ